MGYKNSAKWGPFEKKGSFIPYYFKVVNATFAS
jgi:hypothetical protein